MKKINQLLALLLLVISGLGFWSATPIMAEEDQEEAKQEELLKKEVEAILTEADSQGSQLLTVKRAFCGNLISVEKEGQKLFIEVRGQEKTATYDQDTAMIGIDREKITTDDLETGNYLIAMGYVSRLEPDQLMVKRLVVAETPSPLERESFFGLVSDISSEEEVFILTWGDLVFEVSAAQADFSYVDEDGQLANTDFDYLKEDDKVVVVGQRKDNNGRIDAVRIHLITSQEAPVEPTTAE